MYRQFTIAALFTICLSTGAWAQTAATPPETDTPPQVHPTATVYSDGYQLRGKIHKYASYATLPLFATELALGQSIYNSTTRNESNKNLHAAVGTGIISLFAVNSVTGVWNMWESRNDPEKRGIRRAHGILMLVANAGFAATAATAPDSEFRRNGVPNLDSNRSLHRNLAIGSISIGTASYLMMLFKGK